MLLVFTEEMKSNIISFEGEIRLENVDGQYVPATSKSAQGNRQSVPWMRFLKRLMKNTKGNSRILIE